MRYWYHGVSILRWLHNAEPGEPARLRLPFRIEINEDMGT